jgi:hypothetical protein
MNFLPDDYEAPKSNSQYFKINDGDNKIRILSRPVLGWQDWGPDNKPIRFTMKDKPLKALDPKKPVQHFWSMIIWDYADSKIKIMHLTQATIRNMIQALAKNEEWGNPSGYDLTINRKGSKQLTEYSVTPSPKRPISVDMLRAFHDTPINLNALLVNGDPFTQLDEITPGMFHEEQKKEDKPKVELINKDQLRELTAVLTEVSNEDLNKMMETLKLQGITTLDLLPVKFYDSVKSKALKMREDFISGTKPFDLF